MLDRQLFVKLITALDVLLLNLDSTLEDQVSRLAADEVQDKEQVAEQRHYEQDAAHDAHFVRGAPIIPVLDHVDPSGHADEYLKECAVDESKRAGPDSRACERLFDPLP